MDPLRFALRGSQLVEASAGTGKTFTIGALYLRLVLGHGGEAAFDRPLDPPQILVVTFTEAATQELRDRIRHRLAEGAAAFRLAPGEVAPAGGTPDLLHELRASYPPARWPECARRLQQAAEWMDEAAISTIHGWCQRMLREHAFDSASLFSQTLQPDTEALMQEAVRDWWRSFVYPLPPAQALAVADWWPQPEALAGAVRKLLVHRELLAPGAAPAQALREAGEEAGERLAEWKRPWARWVGELSGLIEGAVAERRLNGQKLGRRKAWLEALREWAEGDARAPALTETAYARLTPGGLDEALLGGPPLRHPALDDLASLPARLATLPDGRLPVQHHAVHWVAERLALEKCRRAEMGFDDMLVQLDAALRRPGQGERLARSIREQFPAALIDEFQDTDALQYRIFDAIYGVRENRPQQALVLIGDPKQAIYSFRGADIHSYLAARADTEGRHSTLGTNFRGAEAMVRTVNHLFSRAEARADGEGAFLFAGPAGNPLPFLPVRAQGRAEAWHVEGQAAPALTFWWHEAEDTRALAAACAAEVLRLLRLGRAGQAGFQRPGAPLAPVRPGDMAVLVNTGREAQAVRAALRRAGVRSVYLSDQDSVFRSEAAADVQRLLAACAAPDDERLLRAALASPLLGLDWTALDRLGTDEAAWEEAVLQFRRLHEQWRRQGVLPMLRRLLHDFGVPRRLLAGGDERRLTDVLHLAELLQEASTRLEGEHALLRFLHEQRGEPGPGGQDDRILRLESDAELLKVVTVHKSKGLEYPLVFLPFGCSFRPVKAADLPIRWHEGGRLRLSLAPDDAQLAAADRERLAEDLRKLYVALTRARHATWIGVAPVREPHRSALGRLLVGAGPFEADALQVALRTLPGECEGIAVAPAPAAPAERFEEPAPLRRWAPEPPLPAPRPPWWVASYSRLRMQGEDPYEELAAPETAGEDTFLEAGEAAVPGARPAGADPAIELHGLPRGASTGTFLHGLLEWAGREGFGRLAEQPALVRAEVERRCRARGWQAHAPLMADWLAGWLRTPLVLPGAAPTAPRDLRHYQVEMEFWFATARVDAGALDRLVRRHQLPGEPRPALAPQALHGMFKGFIDLVFEHAGRWWVADYKSNALGEHDADYDAAALRREVLRHRYELQYVLYVFALHRHLRARLPGYDYERHVGGAAYLFLRGHAGPVRGLHADRPPRALIEALDALFAGEARP
ncbi:exodeoxyribonuclease V subunit beta [Ramlibacter rhizophilus]|uniref:RecBCD enzyme subunit RecB n=2 Tax=Ramlibacter rhizophilus TaxID=1781167 RepID=A0A4Z0C4G3_9BURK|nr:exodeoxyribonuclease V subunit beta [Ramlibacter rhizophilus]